MCSLSHSTKRISGRWAGAGQGAGSLPPLSPPAHKTTFGAENCGPKQEVTKEGQRNSELHRVPSCKGHCVGVLVCALVGAAVDTQTRMCVCVCRRVSVHVLMRKHALVCTHRNMLLNGTIHH